MSSIITTVAVPAAVIATHGLSLLGLWLRLRWRVRQEHARRRYLVAIAQALSAGGQIDERTAEGSWLRVAIRPSRRREVNDG